MCQSWYMMWQLMLYYKRRAAANLALSAAAHGQKAAFQEQMEVKPGAGCCGHAGSSLRWTRFERAASTGPGSHGYSAATLHHAGVLTETTAELAAALTLAAARRVVEADRFMRGGHYKGWLPDLFVGSLLQARPLPVPASPIGVWLSGRWLRLRSAHHGFVCCTVTLGSTLEHLEMNATSVHMV